MTAGPAAADDGEARHPRADSKVNPPAIALTIETIPAAGPIPCHRCGVCCTRWQPLLTTTDIASLAAFLAIDAGHFLASYTRPYPFDDETPLLRQEAGACVFLAWEADGRSRCTVHPARPAVCRGWSADLDKKECRQGLARAGRADGSLDLPVLYPEPDEREEFLTAIAAG